MGTTNGLSLRYPELTETADGPDAFSKLANDVEDYFFDRILPAGVTRMPGYYWGAVSSPPSSGLARPGDTCQVTGLGNAIMQFNGSTWRQTATVEVADLAARNAISTGTANLAALHHGFRVYCLDRYVTWSWNKTDSVWSMVEFNGDIMQTAQGYQATWYGSSATPVGNGQGVGITQWGVTRAANDNFVTLAGDGTFTINIRGRATIIATVESDAAANGRSDVNLRVPGARFPAASGNVGQFVQRRGSDIIRQGVSWTGNVRETNGFFLSVYQYSGGTVNYGAQSLSIEMH